MMSVKVYSAYHFRCLKTTHFVHLIVMIKIMIIKMKLDCFDGLVLCIIQCSEIVLVCFYLYGTSLYCLNYF